VKLQATVASYGILDSKAAPVKKTVTLVLNGARCKRKPSMFRPMDAGKWNFWGSTRRMDSAKEKFELTAATRCRAMIAICQRGARRSAQGFVRRRWTPSRAELYFRDALEFGGDGAFTLESQRPESAAAATLSVYPFIVLNDLGNVPPALDSALQNYVRNGGSVLLRLDLRRPCCACSIWMKRFKPRIMRAARAIDF